MPLVIRCSITDNFGFGRWLPVETAFFAVSPDNHGIGFGAPKSSA